MSTPLGDFSVGESANRYPCEVRRCNVTCARAADVKRHHATKHGGPKTKCGINGCVFAHPRPDKLKLHKLKEHAMPNDVTSAGPAESSSSLERALPYRPAAEHQIALQTPQYYPSSPPSSPIVECVCGGLYTTFMANQNDPTWSITNASIRNVGMTFMDTTTQVQNNGYAALRSGYMAWDPFSPRWYPATGPMVLQPIPAEEAEDSSFGLHSAADDY
ncbi:hypothetical protein BP5796_08431 [Coleophoma crateriformis]|uniref:C2H2-type domain-containing protein n=1 Tax=Coleophoma crateriformis TaxID=565419 RepID=A0A3D8R867_9HELO|nr:hypothetical protein BP5796_08431 [Coleophoma crateriformis]